MDPPAWRETQVDFPQSRQFITSTGISTRFAGASGSYRMASMHSSWKLLFKSNSGSYSAPQYLQHALISDLLDLANTSIQEEAALATIWIDDRPEGLKLQRQDQ